MGVGGRQLRRLFQQHLGTTPVAVAQTSRVLFAKQLIHETKLPMSEVALAAGFGSVRRFNETFQRLFRRPPSALRRKSIPSVAGGAGVTLRLSYRPPYDWASMLKFLETRAICGVESVNRGRYLRTVVEAGQQGTVEVSHLPAAHGLSVTVVFPDLRLLPALVARVRRVFDLNADVETIASHLAIDPLLAPLIAQRPGLRVPGGWDGFELAIRAILGQQVTVEAARQLAGVLVALCGEPIVLANFVQANSNGNGLLSHTFPTPERVLAADLTVLKMPAARKRTLRALAEAALREPKFFEPFGTVEDTVARLKQIPGIGDWTAHYIALRALRETDAFPASDIGLLRSIESFHGARPTPANFLALAEPWRPWRAYAAQHLWTADSTTLLHPVISNG